MDAFKQTFQVSCKNWYPSSTLLSLTLLNKIELEEQRKKDKQTF